MKKSEAVSILQGIAFKSDDYSQFVEVHLDGDKVEVSISSSRPYSVGGGPSLGSEEGLLVNVTGSTFAKAVATLVKHPECMKALLRAEAHQRSETNRQALELLQRHQQQITKKGS